MEVVSVGDMAGIEVIPTRPVFFERIWESVSTVLMSPFQVVKYL